MQYILIAVLVLGTPESPAVSMATFDNVDACLNAGKIFESLVSKATLVSSPQWDCVPKSLPPKK